MTPAQIANAYKAVVRLSGSVFPYKTARSLARLKRRLSEEVDAVSAAERAIVENRGGNVKSDGGIYIKGNDEVDKLVAELNQFRMQEDEVELPTVDISKYVDVLQISPNDIEALDGIVIFEKEEKDGDG